MDKVALVNFCGLCRLGSLMALSLEKENITKKTDQSWQTISVRRDCCSTARVAACHWAWQPCPYVPRGYHVGADPGTTPCGGTSNSRRQTTGMSTSLSSSSSSSFSSRSTAQHSLMDDSSPTHSGTIFFLGGWFHSIGLDIYFSQLGVALHFVTNDIPGEKEERLCGCTPGQVC